MHPFRAKSNFNPKSATRFGLKYGALSPTVFQSGPHRTSIQKPVPYFNSKTAAMAQPIEDTAARSAPGSRAPYLNPNCRLQCTILLPRGRPYFNSNSRTSFQQRTNRNPNNAVLQRKFTVLQGNGFIGKSFNFNHFQSL
jgi:hypothetical protein